MSKKNPRKTALRRRSRVERVKPAPSAPPDDYGQEILDGVETLRLGVGYRIDGVVSDILPAGAESLARAEPVYEDIAGWNQSTVGLRSFAQLPSSAQRYLRRIEAICGVRIDVISTGPEREETIVMRHPFD